jgi:hypothetical protein
MQKRISFFSAAVRLQGREPVHQPHRPRRTCKSTETEALSELHRIDREGSVTATQKQIKDLLIQPQVTRLSKAVL